VDIIERQIRKNKTRLEKRLRAGAFEREMNGAAPSEAYPEEKEFNIVRRKRFAMKPMSVDEAILQMNLLEHEFYAFKNADDENRYSVVYKRNDGGYGLIEAD
jgi:putative sigma-54 modulation protein